MMHDSTGRVWDKMPVVIHNNNSWKLKSIKNMNLWVESTNKTKNDDSRESLIV